MPSQKPSPVDLQAVGVRLVKNFSRLDHTNGIVTLRVECLKCWTQWPERQNAHGFLNSGYWRCPKGCNRGVQA